MYSTLYMYVRLDGLCLWLFLITTEYL